MRINPLMTLITVRLGAYLALWKLVYPSILALDPDRGGDGACGVDRHRFGILGRQLLVCETSATDLAHPRHVSTICIIEMSLVRLILLSLRPNMGSFRQGLDVGSGPEVACDGGDTCGDTAKNELTFQQALRRHLTHPWNPVRISCEDISAGISYRECVPNTSPPSSVASSNPLT